MQYKIFLMLFLINQGELESLKKKSMEKWDKVKSSHVEFSVEDSFFGSEKAKEKSDKYKWEIWNSDEKVKIRKNRINGIPFDITWVFHSEKTGYGLQVNGEKNVAAAYVPIEKMPVRELKNENVKNYFMNPMPMGPAVAQNPLYNFGSQFKHVDLKVFSSKWNEKDAKVVEFFRDETKRDKFQYVFVPEMDYALVYSDIKRTDDSNKIIAQAEMKNDFKKFENIWFPKEFLFTQSFNGTISHSQKYTVEKFEINPNIDEQDFSRKGLIKVGTYVDMGSPSTSGFWDGNNVVPKISSKVSLKDPTPVTTQFSPWFWPILYGSLSLIFGVALWFYFRR